MPMPQQTSKPLFTLLAAAALLILADQLNRLVVLTQRSSEDEKDTPDGSMPMPMLPSPSSTNTTVEVEKMVTRWGGGSWNPLPWSLPRVRGRRMQSSEEFMTELNQLKRSMNISLPWDNDNRNFSLPTPIISLNLPKSATLTLKEFFKCGGFISAHTFIPSTAVRLGDCIRDNFLTNDPPFRGCDRDNATKEEIQFYSDAGVQGFLRGPQCFYSSLNDGGLDHIAQHYPHATIVMMPRPFEDWYKSARKWGDGRLFGIWKRICNFTGSVGHCRTKDDEPCWRDFYEAHTVKVREYAKTHLDLTYVEVQLDESSPSVLESYTGISSRCFQHCKPGKPKDPNINLKRYRKCRPINSW